MTQLWYVAAPVAPPCACDGPCRFFTTGMVSCNCQRARKWLGWLYRACPYVALVCPWLPIVELVGDDGGKERERGLRDCEAVVSKCDGIILVGGRVSPGMERELEAFYRQPYAGAAYFAPTLDLTHLGLYPPDGIPVGLPWPIEARR